MKTTFSSLHGMFENPVPKKYYLKKINPGRMLQYSEFVWTLRSSARVVFNNILLIDTTDRSKVSSDQKGLFLP